MSTELATVAADWPLSSDNAKRLGHESSRRERIWEGPTRRQRAYIARLSLELLSIPYPRDEAEASRVIDRLKNGVEASRVDASTDEIPF